MLLTCCHDGANSRLAVMAIERAVGGAPCDQCTGHTRRGLHRMGTPNRKTHPLLVDCHAIIAESHGSSSLDHFWWQGGRVFPPYGSFAIAAIRVSLERRLGIFGGLSLPRPCAAHWRRVMPPMSGAAVTSLQRHSPSTRRRTCRMQCRKP